MYSAILVHALIDFAPPNDARASLHKMNSASEPVYPETIVKVRAGRWGGPCQPRFGMAKYYDHVFDLKTLAPFSDG